MPSAESGTQLTEAHNPVARISKPDFVDWHMILDTELSQLSSSDTGVLGSLGFTAFGGALGLAPPFVDACNKMSASVALTKFDFAATIAFVLCSALAAICLVLFGLFKWRNAGLAERIRSRPKTKLG